MSAGQIIFVGQSEYIGSLAAMARQEGLTASSVPTLGLARVHSDSIIVLDASLTDIEANAQMVIDCGGHPVGLGALASNAQGLRALADQASEKGLSLREAVFVTADPATTQIQEWIANGTLGALQAIHCEDYRFESTGLAEKVNWRHAAITALFLGAPITSIRFDEHVPDGARHASWSLCQISTEGTAHGVLNRSTGHPDVTDRIVIVGETATCVWTSSPENGSELALTTLDAGRTEFLEFPAETRLSRIVHEVIKSDAGDVTTLGNSQIGISELQEAVRLAAENKQEFRMNNEQTDYFIHPTSVVDGPVEIGTDTRIWHFSKLLGPLKIGQGCSLGQNVVVERNVEIGNNVKIQNNVSVYSGVILEDDVFCGPSMVFTNVGTPRSAYPRKGQYLETRVRRGASIGANATIVCGNTLGQYAFIGAGSVVTRDVPDYALVYGNPARIRGWACYCGERLNLGLGVDEQESVSCAHCERHYSRDGLSVTQQD